MVDDACKVAARSLEVDRPRLAPTLSAPTTAVKVRVKYSSRVDAKAREWSPDDVEGSTVQGTAPDRALLATCYAPAGLPRTMCRRPSGARSTSTDGVNEHWSMLRYTHGPFGVIAVAGGGPAGFRLDIGGLRERRPVKPAGQLSGPRTSSRRNIFVSQVGLRISAWTRT